MPIPSSSITHVEIHAKGLVAAAGSTSKKSDITFNFRRTSTSNPLSKANIEAAFQTAIMIPVTNALNLRYVQTMNTVRFIDDALDAPVEITRAVAGAIAGDSMSTLCMAFLLFRTGLRGKSYRGCRKLFPLSESDSTLATADLLNAAAKIRFLAIASAFVAGFTDSNSNVWVPEIVSRKLSTLRTNPTTVIANDVISGSVNQRIGRMIKREVASVY